VRLNEGTATRARNRASDAGDLPTFPADPPCPPCAPCLCPLPASAQRFTSTCSASCPLWQVSHFFGWGLRWGLCWGTLDEHSHTNARRQLGPVGSTRLATESIKCSARVPVCVDVASLGVRARLA